MNKLLLIMVISSSVLFSNSLELNNNNSLLLGNSGKNMLNVKSVTKSRECIDKATTIEELETCNGKPIVVENRVRNVNSTPKKQSRTAEEIKECIQNASTMSELKLCE